MLAEGMKSVFRKMLGLVCRYGNKKEVIRLRGQWVEMDPNEWKTDYDMSVSVGLGTGNRDQQVGQLTNLLNIDKEIIQLQGGANGPIVTMQNVYEKLKRMVEAMGMKGVENYFTDPAEQNGEPDQDEPDPMAAEKAKADAEIEKVRIKAAADIEIAKIKAEADLMIAGLRAPPELYAGEEGPPEEPEPVPEPQEPANEPDMMPPPDMPQ